MAWINSQLASELQNCLKEGTREWESRVVPQLIIWWVLTFWKAVRNKVDKFLEGTKDNKGKGSGILMTLISISRCKLFPQLLSFLPIDPDEADPTDQSPDLSLLPTSSKSMHPSGKMLLASFGTCLLPASQILTAEKAFLAAGRSPTTNNFAGHGTPQHHCRKQSKRSSYTRGLLGDSHFFNSVVSH
jgi:hypothetical protein